MPFLYVRDGDPPKPENAQLVHDTGWRIGKDGILRRTWTYFVPEVRDG